MATSKPLTPPRSSAGSTPEPQQHHHHKQHTTHHHPSHASSSAPSPLSLQTLQSLLLTPFTLSLPLTSPLWTLIEHVYSFPPSHPRRPPGPRVRDPSKPMQVLCVGLPRTGTESLQQALLHLGYDHTYHGWDIVYDPSGLSYAPGWVALARKKFLSNSQPNITTQDFDQLLGHCTAVTDAAASVFASEIIAAYPDAKVILNSRGDMQTQGGGGAWQRSLENTLVKANDSWAFWIASWLDRECFWAWHVYERFLWPGLFRCGLDGYGGFADAVRRGHGAGIAREHTAMIRGLVPPERLLEWNIADGWEPLCKFLGKPAPNIEFPHANAGSGPGGWMAREEQCVKRWVEGAFIRLFWIVMGLIGAVVAWWTMLK